MKKLLLSLTVVFIGLTNLIAQEDTFGDIAKETCECISKKNIDELSKQALEAQLGLCIFGGIGQNPERMTKLNLDFSNQSAMEKFGEKVGLRMAEFCPTILMKIGLSTIDEDGDSVVENSLTGTIKSISGDEVYIINFETENGRSQSFLWLSYFEGSNLLIEDSKRIFNKKVKIQYDEIEVYSPKAKDFFKRKVITNLVEL